MFTISTAPPLYASLSPTIRQHDCLSPAEAAAIDTPDRLLHTLAQHPNCFDEILATARHDAAPLHVCVVADSLLHAAITSLAAAAVADLIDTPTLITASTACLPQVCLCNVLGYAVPLGA